MKILISFGQDHVHYINDKTFDHNCLAIIEGENWNDCRDKAHRYFNGKFCTDYPIEKLNDPNFMKWYYRGGIEV